jgi:hypothetical protein
MATQSGFAPSTTTRKRNDERVSSVEQDSMPSQEKARHRRIANDRDGKTAQPGSVAVAEEATESERPRGPAVMIGPSPRQASIPRRISRLVLMEPKVRISMLNFGTTRGIFWT